MRAAGFPAGGARAARRDPSEAFRPAGMEIVAVAVPQAKPPKPARACYRIAFPTSLNDAGLRAALRGPMEVRKKTKTRETAVDIAPMIELRALAAEDGRARMEVCLPAAGDQYLNPTYILQYFGAAPEESDILRTEIRFS